MTTIVIDDSGSPGSSVQSQFLKNERNTWAAVLIDSHRLSKLEEDLKYFNNQIQTGLGVGEIHFTDLINGNNEYKMLEQHQRLELFSIFCAFYKEYQFPFFVQTTNPETLAEHGVLLQGKRAMYGGLDLIDHKVQGLLLLFIKITDYLQENGLVGSDIDFIIDEGLKKPGTVVSFPYLEAVNKVWKLRFESSQKVQKLQIADFVAYSVNRMQTTMVKAPSARTNYDKQIVSLISDALGRSGVSGVSYVEANVHNTTMDDYDYEQLQKRLEDGNLDKYWAWRRKRGDLL